ncbi:asparaginase [Thioclava sp. F28-4]|uniref:asparaginase n=1 Tax=Thioclava sp. F28-4 TaxID=1915315 RepID=UPI000998680A|nr:asparaginase [Thioclava sp. F28-4]OOY04659.1 L-asparaginase 1 [Thioclava sp. F28-4]
MALLLIHTGGTIGMVASDVGFVPQQGVVEEFLATLPEGREVETLRLDPLIDSANATPADWNRIAETIAAHHDRCDGVIVTHGTDTLAYTAGALCFALEGLAKPVIVTGSMLPLSVEGNDGARNLRDAIAAAGQAAPGVWVQFAGRLLHGARVRKSHSRAFDAFAADPSDIPPRQPGPRLTRHPIRSARIAVLAVAPGAEESLLDHAVKTCDGLVLRCYGSGTAPDTPGVRAALATAQARAIPVIAVSQCPEGGMALGTYAAGAILRDHGVIDGRDMTPEAAYTKLAHVLSLDDPQERAARLSRALCGEYTP